MQRLSVSAPSALILAAAAFTLLPDAALAYVGPGAGLTAIGTVLALIGAVLLALVGFVWYPLKRLVRRPSGPDARGGHDGDSK